MCDVFVSRKCCVAMLLLLLLLHGLQLDRWLGLRSRQELTTIGTKLTFVAGVVVCGGSVIGFGCLDAVPSGTTFIVMSIVIRSVEACGCAAFITASLAILANEFPNNVATAYAVLEMLGGLGFMIGPALGELLYEAGGFRLPFISSGAAFLAVGGLASLLLPPQTEINQRQRKSFWSFMTILPVWLIGFFYTTVCCAFGLADVALAVHVKKNYHLSPVLFTSLFLVIGGVYAVSSPVYGVIADKKPQLGPALVTVGSLIRSVALILVGPATFLLIPK
ncbi:MFS-type transporter SLC18B1 [Lamellibrachia satsuma]|nr:MFS-type transporter SLC18B1 [Lamellibrachia satsuma]